MMFYSLTDCYRRLDHHPTADFHGSSFLMITAVIIYRRWWRFNFLDSTDHNSFPLLTLTLLKLFNCHILCNVCNGATPFFPSPSRLVRGRNYKEFKKASREKWRYSSMHESNQKEGVFTNTVNNCNIPSLSRRQ